MLFMVMLLPEKSLVLYFLNLCCCWKNGLSLEANPPSPCDTINGYLYKRDMALFSDYVQISACSFGLTGVGNSWKDVCNGGYRLALAISECFWERLYWDKGRRLFQEACLRSHQLRFY